MPDAHVPYRLIVQQASIFRGETAEKRHEKVFGRLSKYGVVKDKTERMMRKIELACNWADDIDSSTEQKFEIELDDKQKNAIRQLIQSLGSLSSISPSDPEAPKNLQSIVFDTARSNGIEPKEFFVLLYRMLINADRGPRIGNYVLDLGIDRTCTMLERYL